MNDFAECVTLIQSELAHDRLDSAIDAYLKAENALRRLGSDSSKSPEAELIIHLRKRVEDEYMSRLASDVAQAESDVEDSSAEVQARLVFDRMCKLSLMRSLRETDSFDEACALYSRMALKFLDVSRIKNSNALKRALALKLNVFEGFTKAFGGFLLQAHTWLSNMRSAVVDVKFEKQILVVCHDATSTMLDWLNRYEGLEDDEFLELSAHLLGYLRHFSNFANDDMFHALSLELASEYVRAETKWFESVTKVALSQKEVGAVVDDVLGTLCEATMTRASRTLDSNALDSVGTLVASVLENDLLRVVASVPSFDLDAFARAESTLIDLYVGHKQKSYAHAFLHAKKTFTKCLRSNALCVVDHGLIPKIVSAVRSMSYNIDSLKVDAERSNSSSEWGVSKAFREANRNFVEPEALKAFESAAVERVVSTLQAAVLEIWTFTELGALRLEEDVSTWSRRIDDELLFLLRPLRETLLALSTPDLNELAKIRPDLRARRAS